MELLYPLSSELITFVHSLNRTIEQSMRRECHLNVVQYRALSCMRQAGELEEASMERVMTISASQLSQALSNIAKRGYARSRRYRGPAKLWSLTALGNRKIQDADAVLVEACNQVFGPLGPKLGNAIRAGSMLTNQRHGIVRIEGGQFFEEFACFEAFLQSERITKETTKSFGVTETEFRILFELYVSGPSSKTALSKRLIMPASVVTEACASLTARSLAFSQVKPDDKRVRTITLTEEGRRFTEEVAEQVDHRNYEDLRPTSTEERQLYQQMADIVVQRT